MQRKSFPTALTGVALALALPALGQTVASRSSPATATTMDINTMLDTMPNKSITNAGPKMDPSLLALVRQWQAPAAAKGTTGTAAALSGLTVQGPTVVSGRVLVEAFVRSDEAAAAAELTAAGADKLSRHGKVIAAWMPVANITSLSQAKHIESMRMAHKPISNIGRVTSQGDAAQRSDTTRLLFGVNGAGTKVGIISDSWNTLGGAAAGVAAGELPGAGNPNGFTTPVAVLKEPAAGSDEGRGMGEIIHDVAPGAALTFYSADSYLDHITGIRAMAQAGATVIVDDLGYFAEPWYQASPIGAASAQLSRELGTVFLTSAGNQDRDSLESNFNPAPAQPLLVNGQNVGNWKLHRFANGQVTVPITLKAGNLLSLVLQWDEPFASASPLNAGIGAGSDLDLFLFLESQGVNIALPSAADNVGADAVEVISGLSLRDPNAVITLHLGIGQPEGSPGQPNAFKVVAFDAGSTDTDIGRGTVFNKPTVLGHSNEPALITSCAVRYDQVNGGARAVPRAFSSVGGFAQTINAAGQRIAPLQTAKPDVCSPDGANTSFFGGRDLEGDGAPNFSGTSASAPHAAAVVALMQEAAGGPKNLSPARAKNILLRSTFEMDDPTQAGFQFGYDTKSGQGFLDPIRAVQSAASLRLRRR
jgi:hypothetical protein